MTTQEIERVSDEEVIADALAEQGGDDQETAIEAGEPAEETIEEVLEALEPSPKWDRRYKDTFNKFGELEGGRDYQQAMLDLYNGEQAHSTKISQERADYERQLQSFNQVHEPYQQFLLQNGLSPTDAYRQGLGFLVSLSQDPQAFVQQLAKRAGVQLADQDQAYIPPEVQGLQGELAQLKQQLSSNEQRALQQERARVEQQLTAFASEQDADGNPLHPHFQTVQEHMGKLISSGMAADLKSAYDMAIRLNPDIQEQDTKAKAQQEAARKAAEAKKAKDAAKRPPGKGSGKDNRQMTDEEAIRAALDEQKAA